MMHLDIFISSFSSYSHYCNTVKIQLYNDYLNPYELNVHIYVQ